MVQSPDQAPGRIPPTRLPLFPLAGALLLPHARLPLNIFEPRYLAMVRAALAGDWSIGMIQPREEGIEPPPLFEVGCVGRITSLQETDDGRYLIVLTGTSRFRLREEIAVETPFRQALVDYDDFAGDREVETPSEALDMPGLIGQLRAYLENRGITLDDKAISALPEGRLVDYLCMVCPLETAEKQALLEASDLPERYRVLSALLATEGGSEEPAGRVIPFPGTTKH